MTRGDRPGGRTLARVIESILPANVAAAEREDDDAGAAEALFPEERALVASAIAARRAGLAAIGMLSGGFSRHDLEALFSIGN